MAAWMMNMYRDEDFSGLLSSGLLNSHNKLNFKNVIDILTAYFYFRRVENETISVAARMMNGDENVSSV